MADDLLERAARRPAATASCLQLHALPLRHPPVHHSSFAGGRPGLGRAITCHSAGARLAKHPQRPASGSIPAQADAGRGLLHARALLPAQGLGKVRRASCHCNLLPWLHPCLARLTPFFLTRYRALLSFVHILQVSCICLTVLTSAGAFERSEIQEWPLDGVSGLRCSAGPFVGERDVCAVSILLQRTCRLDSPGTCVH